MTSQRQNLLTLLAAGGMLLFTACGSTKISRILNNPVKYQNRNVKVDGTVTNSFGIPFAAGLYQVQDETGRIYVLSNRGGVPTKGAHVNVSGKVTSGVTVGGRSYGTVLREHDLNVK